MNQEMQFDIDNLVRKYQGKDFIDVYMELTKEVHRLDGLYNLQRPKQRNYNLERYRDYAGDFLFFLNTGVTPSGIGLDGLRHFLPVIRSLVEKKQLKADVLDRFH